MPIIAQPVHLPAGALLAKLHAINSERGYLPEEDLRVAADELALPLSLLYSAATFYSAFSFKPRGLHTVQVCLGTACYVRGGKRVLDALKQKLGIDVGETTADRMFSLEVARCFGACGLAPTMSIDDEVHQRVKPTKTDEILDQYR